MISIYMIFTSLATTALAKGYTECNFFETTGPQQCFGAVGQLLVFHLPNTVNPHIRLKKDNKYMIFKVKNHNVSVHKEYVHYPASFTNGTFKLGNAMKKHSGDYVLEQFGPDGALVKNVNVHLEIQAPVSKPAVSQMCLSQEEMNFSCSSEGDAAEFVLTLDGLSLIQTRGHSRSLSSRTANTQPVVNKTEHDTPSVSDVTISLHGQLTGNLMCHVWNNVSREETVIHLNSCKEFSSFSVVIVAVIASAITLPLLVALGLGIKHLHNKPRPTTVHEGNSQDEIVYTDVKVITNTEQKQNAT